MVEVLSCVTLIRHQQKVKAMRESSDFSIPVPCPRKALPWAVPSTTQRFWGGPSVRGQTDLDGKIPILHSGFNPFTCYNPPQSPSFDPLALT
eukprot:956134-Amphidinium_carterae.1